MFEPPSCDPVDQPDREDESTDIRYDIQSYNLLVIIFDLQQGNSTLTEGEISMKTALA